MSWNQLYFLLNLKDISTVNFLSSKKKNPRGVQGYLFCRIIIIIESWSLETDASYCTVTDFIYLFFASVYHKNGFEIKYL